MREITLLDGSIGQELVLRSKKKPTPLWSTKVLLENPELVNEIHTEYFRAGSTIATTNTYPVSGSAKKAWLTNWKRWKVLSMALTPEMLTGRVAGSI